MNQEKRVAMNKATKRVLGLFESTGMAIDPFEKAVGLTEGTIKNLKNHKYNASADTICRVAEYFNVSTDYVIGYTDFPKCPTSWWILRRTLITLNKSLSVLSEETGFPLQMFADWELGVEPDEKTLWAICNTLQLKKNPFEKTKKAVPMERPITSLTTEMPDLFKEQRFVNTAKLYNELPDEYRERAYGLIMGIAISIGLNVDKILGR